MFYQVSFPYEMFPSEDADKKEYRRNAPSHRYHDDHLVARPPCSVLGRDLDGAEPINVDELI